MPGTATGAAVGAGTAESSVEASSTPPPAADSDTTAEASVPPVKTYKHGPNDGLNKVVPKYTLELRWRHPPSIPYFNRIELSTRRVDSTKSPCNVNDRNNNII